MELISVHVPKTAGITFGKILDRVYGPEHVVRDDNVFDFRTIDPSIRAIHGHFIVARYHGLYPEAKRVAWIRHPVRWVISLYYYTKHIEVLPSNPLACRMAVSGMTLLEFAEHPIARNNYARIWLNGLAPDDFFFLGIQEHMRDDLRDLARMLGWGNVTLPTENANPEPGYSEVVRGHLADRRLVARIESFFDEDMAIYERALKIRARRNRRVDRGHALRAPLRALAALARR